MIPKLAIQITSSSLSCYTHDKNGITFKPTDFFGDVSTLKRDLSIDYAIWDHGDGTLSKSNITAAEITGPASAPLPTSSIPHIFPLEIDSISFSISKVGSVFILYNSLF